MASQVPSYYPFNEFAPLPPLDAASLTIEDYPPYDQPFELDCGGGGGSGGGNSVYAPGFKFRPTDEELIVHYLQLEFIKASLPQTRIIKHADIYDYEPHQLSGLVEEDHGDGKMYFYTMIKKIGKSKTDRSIKSKKGNWKPTQAPKEIKGSISGTIIGYKTSFKYYEDKKKTQWLMQEYKLNTSHHSSRQLVLAVVYFHPQKKADDSDDDC
ncbi:putative NAC domain-containing protein 94 [Salvia miltiorrhiza]|uniref:putative NAC domain-containing protein 94 n=1 Tax=Salvia miltiorrhiza TaxID=226208 RepID=UPI0025ABCFFE|nr:putative NAC domain-containing protein 94 [Salvia miltiorrhiza]